MEALGVNKVILVGHLGQDLEVRYMPNGGAVVNLTLATSETWRDKQTGEMRENTEWHRVVMFGKLAEVAGEYLRKGAQGYIEASCAPAPGRTMPESRATSPRCWSGRTAPCRCSSAAVNPECLRAPRSRRILPPRHNLLRPQLNPRKRRAVRKAVRMPPRLSNRLSLSRMISHQWMMKRPFKPR